jgi:hypothetical protein
MTAAISANLECAPVKDHVAPLPAIADVVNLVAIHRMAVVTTATARVIERVNEYQDKDEPQHCANALDQSPGACAWHSLTFGYQGFGFRCQRQVGAYGKIA